jgi:hypothetical protein
MNPRMLLALMLLGLAATARGGATRVVARSWTTACRVRERASWWKSRRHGTEDGRATLRRIPEASRLVVFVQERDGGPVHGVTSIVLP